MLDGGLKLYLNTCFLYRVVTQVKFINPQPSNTGTRNPDDKCIITILPHTVQLLIKG